MIELWRLPKPHQLLLERVARAICAVDGRDPDYSTHPRSDGPVILDVAIPEWRNYLPHAVAAVGIVDPRWRALGRVAEAADAAYQERTDLAPLAAALDALGYALDDFAASGGETGA